MDTLTGSLPISAGGPLVAGIISDSKRRETNITMPIILGGLTDGRALLDMCMPANTLMPTNDNPR